MTRKNEKEARPASAKNQAGLAAENAHELDALDYNSIKLIAISDARSGSVMVQQQPSKATMRILDYAAFVARQADENGFRPYELMISDQAGAYVFGGPDHGISMKLEPSESLDAAKKLMKALGLTFFSVTLLDGDRECYVTYGSGIEAEPEFVAIFEY